MHRHPFPFLHRVSLLLVSFVLTLAGLLFAAGCNTPKPPAAPKPPPVIAAVPPAEIPNRYVGNNACQPCHAKEFKVHAASRHAVTLHLARREALGKSMPPLGRIPGTNILLKEKAGALLLTGIGFETHTIPIDLAFGSGKTGMTYGSVLGNRLMELHKSYFPPRHQWYLTPGHEEEKPSAVGMVHAPEFSRKCVGCHSVPSSGDALKPEPGFFGVGCESCHGQGGAHVDAMRSANRTNIYIERMGRWDATRLNELCGNCHRNAKDVNLQTEQAQMTNRFQSYGLMKSRCFLESGNTLSCITCHSPHENASTDVGAYTVVCLNCHSGRPNQAGRVATQGKVCPVNRTSNCTTCHMPKRAAVTSLPTMVADHWIRVYPRKQGGKH